MIAQNRILGISEYYEGVYVDKYVVMPNHIHAIIVIENDGIDEEIKKPLPTLSTIVGQYKAGVSKEIHKVKPDMKIWQNSFYDHIIRNEASYLEIWKYIDENPIKWKEEYFH